MRKELNLKSKEIIDELKSMNVEVSNHMQALEEEQIKALDKNLKPLKRKDTNKQNTKIITKNLIINKILTIKKNNKVRIIVNQRRKRTKQQRKTAK